MNRFKLPFNLALSVLLVGVMLLAACQPGEQITPETTAGLETPPGVPPETGLTATPGDGAGGTATETAEGTAADMGTGTPAGTDADMGTGTPAGTDADTGTGTPGAAGTGTPESTEAGTEEATETPTPAPTATPLAQTPTPFAPTPAAAGQQGVYQPISAEECIELQTLLQEDYIGGTASNNEAPFLDYVTGDTGTACTLIVTGTGASFGHLRAATATLRTLFTDQGWEQDEAYTVETDAAVLQGFRMDDRLALASAGWAPAPEVTCPPGQPLSECQLELGQQNFTIIVQIAERTP